MIRSGPPAPMMPSDCGCSGYNGAFLRDSLSSHNRFLLFLRLANPERTCCVVSHGLTGDLIK